jgi:NAD(P)-dependent dehydrogenase (short-subunit alcohol dehydrogenase family)
MSMEMQGKTCLVTGATLGIGKETALGLARMGAHVVIVGRDHARTRETAGWIAQQSGNAAIDFLIADLSSQAEVRRVAAAYKDKHRRLDVLLNNAGAVFTKQEKTADGFERTWALNHLAEFLMTQLFLARWRRARRRASSSPLRPIRAGPSISTFCTAKRNTAELPPIPSRNSPISCSPSPWRVASPARA